MGFLRRRQEAGVDATTVQFDEVSKRWRVVGRDGTVIEDGFDTNAAAWQWASAHSDAATHDRIAAEHLIERKRTALMDAGYIAHPQFAHDGRGWIWKGDGEGLSPEAVIEWFQINHPTQARAVERAIEAELT